MSRKRTRQKSRNPPSPGIPISCLQGFDLFMSMPAACRAALSIGAGWALPGTRAVCIAKGNRASGRQTKPYLLPVPSASELARPRPLEQNGLPVQPLWRRYHPKSSNHGQSCPSGKSCSLRPLVGRRHIGSRKASHVRHGADREGPPDCLGEAPEGVGVLRLERARRRRLFRFRSGEVVTQSVTQRSKSCYPMGVLKCATREKGWEINGRGDRI
jgi:hypothetical protein